jgi:hypothetical protein
LPDPSDDVAHTRHNDRVPGEALVNRQVILAVENQGAATYGHDTENGNHHRDLAGPRVPVLALVHAGTRA